MPTGDDTAQRNINCVTIIFLKMLFKLFLFLKLTNYVKTQILLLFIWNVSINSIAFTFAIKIEKNGFFEVSKVLLFAYK